jgi:hypothetical protein
MALTMIVAVGLWVATRVLRSSALPAANARAAAAPAAAPPAPPAPTPATPSAKTTATPSAKTTAAPSAKTTAAPSAKTTAAPSAKATAAPTAAAVPAHEAPPARASPARTPEPPAIPGLDQAQALVRAGRGTAALDTLRKLRARYPDNAEVAYLMGNVYFDRLWWIDGFAAYRVAVSRNPAYRQDRTLIANVLKSFMSERYGSVGARFIEREIGAAAIPYLENAARSRSQNERARAMHVLAKLNQAR